MKKNKLTFIIAASLLALTSLAGCNINTPSQTKSNGVSSASQLDGSSISQGESANPSSGGNSVAPSSQAPVSSDQPSSVTPQPSSEALKSSSQAPQPSSTVPQPSSSAPRPSSSAPAPSSSTPAPSSSAPAPSSSTPVPSSSVPQPSSSSPSSSSPSVKTEWTNEEAAVMSDHLYGLVLPFVDMPVSVTYDQTTDAVSIFSVGNMEDGFLSRYAELFDYDSGWEGGDMSYELGLYSGFAYVFRKAVTYNNQTRYVLVYFFGGEYNVATEEFEYSRTGKFYLQASDPFMYTYPAEFIAGWLKTTFGADIVPPVLEADYYQLDSEGVLLAYSENNLEDTYKRALEATNNFVVSAERDLGGYYVAHPIDGSYQIRFKYDSDQKMMMIEVSEYQGWNSSRITKFYEKYNQAPLSFPSLDIDGASYKFEEGSYNELLAGQGLYSNVSATYTISKTGLTNAPLKEYASKLREAGYAVSGVAADEDGTINDYYFQKALKDGVFYASQISYVASPIGGGKPQIAMYFFATGQEMPDLLVNWPSDKIATFLGDDVKDVVPAYTGLQCGFGFESNKYAVVSINVDEISSKTIKEDYAALLLKNEFTLNNGKYISKNNQISIQLADPQGYGTYDIFQIRIDKIDNTPVNTPWPSADVADAIENNLKMYNLDTLEVIPITDTIPALDVSSASECYVNNNLSNKFEIVVGGLANSVNSFKATLKAAGWSEDPFYGFDTTINQYGALISPNKQMVIYFDTVGNDLSIYVATYWNQYYATWPTAEMNPVIAAWGVTKDIIPTFDSASYVQWENPESTKKINIMVMVGRDLYQLFIDTYKDALTKAGYSYDENRGGYVTENAELLIKVGINQLTTLPEVNVEYIGADIPAPVQIFKLVGLNDNWNYDESELVFVDATNPDEVAQLWYVTQSKVEFDVEIGTEFKVTDGTTWYGMSVVEEMGAESFSEGDQGNIKANQKGHVALYLKTYTDGRTGLVIRFTPELLPWPEEEINEFFAGDFEFVPEVKIAGASYEVAETYDGEDFKAIYIVATVENGEEAVNNAIQELENQFGYEYDEEIEAFVSSREGLPAYDFYQNEDNSYLIVIILLPEVEVPEATWANAQLAMLEYLGEEKDLPNLELEGAVAYEVDDDVLTISFPEGTDPYESMTTLAARLHNSGYHYARNLDALVNIEKGLIITLTGMDAAIEVKYNLFAPENEGYGIVVSYDDPEEGIVYESVFAEFNKEEDEVNEYFIAGYEFKEGMRFYAYNFNNEQDFALAIDSYSLGGNYADYIEYDEETGEFVIKQDFTADIYLKLKFGSDSVYFGFAE